MIEFAFCLYCCGFSIKVYHSSTLPSSSSRLHLPLIVHLVTSASAIIAALPCPCGIEHSLQIILPLWPSAASPDSVVIISSSSFSSSYRPSDDFSVWDYCTFTMPLWPSASSPDSVVIISWSSLDSDVIVSSGLLN